ncbi:hypothetical protein GGR56DRAFT_648941 [Xylariaceae sp. FL0804]|nr:hypothetical protein GGR56DRAFT_648941 [Xylariaceae sp. FL0804]
MKVVSEEESAAHYREVLKGGLVGGTVGLAAGLAGVLGASRRYPAFRGLTVPFRTFLVMSSLTFGSIVTAERYSVDFHRAQNPDNAYRDAAQRAGEAAREQAPAAERLKDWARTHRYQLVAGAWAASMVGSLAMVGRNRYLSTSQKLVQARVYAQGLTLAVLVASAALETADARSGAGRWETVRVVDPDDPEHKHLIEKKVHKEEYEGQDLWKDMVAAEERRMEARKAKNSSSAATKNTAKSAGGEQEQQQKQ